MVTEKCAQNPPKTPKPPNKALFDPFFAVFWTSFFCVFLKKIKKNKKKTGSNVRPIFFTLKKKYVFLAFFRQNGVRFGGVFLGGGPVFSILSKNIGHWLKSGLLPLTPKNFFERG